MPKHKKNKKVVVAVAPAPTKRPLWRGEPTFEGRHLSWRFSSVDLQGSWAWTNVPADSFQRIMHKLPDFERLCTPSDLKNVLHSISVDKLGKAARDRLGELQHDDIEELHGWRVSGRQRLWCAAYDGIMYVLWWDPKHEVYPVAKKYT